MEMDSDSFSKMSFDKPMAFKSFMNGSGRDLMSSNSMDGMALTASTQSGRTGMSQMFAGSKSSSIQTSLSSSSGGGVSGEEIPESVLEELRNRGLLHGNQKITATQKKTTISASSTAAVGVTRSFSSNSGFPLTSSSMSEMNSMGMGNEVAVMGSNNNPTVDLSLLSSPFRKFNFRNFEGPLWRDNISPMGTIVTNLKDNRNTWDLSSSLKSKSKVSFSASQSQHAVFESCNGAYRLKTIL